MKLDCFVPSEFAHTPPPQHAASPGRKPKQLWLENKISESTFSKYACLKYEHNEFANNAKACLLTFPFDNSPNYAPPARAESRSLGKALQGQSSRGIFYRIDQIEVAWKQAETPGITRVTASRGWTFWARVPARFSFALIRRNLRVQPT